MWQVLTGECYLTARSDLDLCWPVSEAQQAQTLVEELRHIEATSSVRLDGELRLPDGGGVAWREFADRCVDEVLVKTLDGVSAMARGRLFDARPSTAAAA
jgi:phosphoribosyl-dephospho-CoA transferase